MPARAYRFLLLELLITAGLGCATVPAVPSGEAGDFTANSKRRPKASTYVAYGELQEKAALDPGRSPTEQQELRNQARAAYLEGLKTHPNDRSVLMALARLYDMEGDYEHAVATYKQAVQVYPKDAALWNELGMCFARRKSWDLALSSLYQAVQLEPKNRSYGHAYGFALARAQRYEESFTVLAKLDGAARAHYDLARMLHHLDQDGASKQQLRLALAKNPDFTAAQQLLNELEAAAGSVSPASRAAAVPEYFTPPEN
jgi:tetratricopeptide (TPR) repeat protein